MADNEPLWNRPAVTTIPSVLWQWFVWSNFSSSVVGLQSFLLLEIVFTSGTHEISETALEGEKDYTEGEVQLSVFSINETTQENSLQGICSPVSLLCPALCVFMSLCLVYSIVYSRTLRDYCFKKERTDSVHGPSSLSHYYLFYLFPQLLFDPILGLPPVPFL